MKAAVDLHIHSCLSPCGEDDMTPGNIAGMAHLKGLDVIAVCDHNAARNLPAVERCCLMYGVALLPGMEVTTAEEVHALCYFPSVDRALALDAALDAVRMAIPNRPEMWGEQRVLNERDEPIGTVGDWLVPAIGWGLDELVLRCDAAGGVVVPAHINRGASGLLIALGFLPPAAGYAALEVSPVAPAPTVDLGAYKLLSSSDAHRLEDIAERDHFIDLPEISRDALWEALLGWRDRARMAAP